jgi:hypothetical protein
MPRQQPSSWRPVNLKVKSWGAASLVVSANCLIAAYDDGKLAAMQHFADLYVTNLRTHIETMGKPVCARDIDSLTDIQAFLIFLRVSILYGTRRLCHTLETAQPSSMIPPSCPLLPDSQDSLGTCANVLSLGATHGIAVLPSKRGQRVHGGPRGPRGCNEINRTFKCVL